MDHSQAITIIAAFAEHPDAPPPGQRAAPSAFAAALAHVAGCPTCAAGAGQLLAALRLDAEDRLTCAECEDQLAEYLAALTMGHGAAPHWADMVVHLAGCPACASALADLAELADLADGSLGVEPPAYPPPHPTAAPSPRPAWRLDELGRLLVDLARALRPPAPAVAPAGLKAGPARPALAETTLDHALPDLELHIALEGRPESERRTLLVTVSIPSRGGWPNLGGSEVALLDEGEEVARATTDAFGTAAFDLAAATIDGLSLAVRPAQPAEG